MPISLRVIPLKKGTLRNNQNNPQSNNYSSHRPTPTPQHRGLDLIPIKKDGSEVKTIPQKERK